MAGGRRSSRRAAVQAAAAVAGRLGRAATAGARAALAAVRSETGRRLGRAAALVLVLAALVVGLYDHADVPTASARPAVGDSVAGGGRARADEAGERPGRRAVRPSGRPAEVAVAWYAASQRLPRARVRALQQDRLSAREVRVLVLADAGRGRLRTALVRVRLGADGWRVP
jgi:hypothetical protein